MTSATVSTSRFIQDTTQILSTCLGSGNRDVQAPFWNELIVEFVGHAEAATRNLARDMHAIYDSRQIRRVLKGVTNLRLTDLDATTSTPRWSIGRVSHTEGTDYHDALLSGGTDRNQRLLSYPLAVGVDFDEHQGTTAGRFRQICRS